MTPTKYKICHMTRTIMVWNKENRLTEEFCLVLPTVNKTCLEGRWGHARINFSRLKLNQQLKNEKQNKNYEYCNVTISRSREMKHWKHPRDCATTSFDLKTILNILAKSYTGDRKTESVAHLRGFGKVLGRLLLTWFDINPGKLCILMWYVEFTALRP